MDNSFWVQAHHTTGSFIAGTRRTEQTVRVRERRDERIFLNTHQFICSLNSNSVIDVTISHRLFRAVITVVKPHKLFIDSPIESYSESKNFRKESDEEKTWAASGVRRSLKVNPNDHNNSLKSEISDIK